MKNLIKILFVIFVFGQNAFSQTIYKEASNANPYIGEEFYYTITLDNLTDLSDLDYIEDSLGPELDYISVEYDPIMLYLLSFGPITGIGCASYSDAASTIHNFRLDFNNCNGNVIGGFDSFSFKIKVKLNELACNLTSTYDNTAELYLKSQSTKPISSNLESITVNKNDPFVLQKTFRSDTNGELVYDVRLSSSSGNFYPLDFNSNPTFRDNFTFPSCLAIGVNDVEVVLITDENTTPMTVDPAFSYNKSITGNTIHIDWLLQGANETTTSILYLVKIKKGSCTSCSPFFKFQNEVFFKAKDKCGNPINKSKQFNIDNSACLNGEIKIPGPITCKIDLDKEVQLDGNNLNLTMKGCTGKYIITINNCSGRIKYKNFTLTDVIPGELDVNGPITITGNATHVLNNNNLTVKQTAYLLPGETVEVTIPFEVNVSQENFIINNCTDISLYGFDNFNVSYNETDQDCAPPIVTVPNEVAVVANKILCSDAKNKCGPFTNNDNLPGDEVEYALHFYNYGTVEARDVKIKDILPPYFKIQDINQDVKIYTVRRGGFPDLCDMSGMKDITSEVVKSYSTSTNLLEIDMKKRLLYEFTCEGIVQYIVKIKAKIDMDAPNGVYDNIFVINYKDPNLPNINAVVSNKVTNIVNVNNLVIGSKTFEAFETDCVNKTKKVTYQIAVANMGTFPVIVDIDDVLTVPSPANVVSVGNFQLSVNAGLFTPISVSNATTSGFYIHGMSLQPCEYKVITYDVVYDTNLLSGNQTVQVCNNATAKVYVKDKNNSKVIPVVTANPSLIQNYFKATSDAEKLQAITIIKDYKELLDNKSGHIDLGVALLGQKCVDLTDCINGSDSGCFTDRTSSFDFQITGMNRNGEISTTLINNNPNKKISQIEYLLTDVKQIDTCEDEVKTITIRGKKYDFVNHCFGCSENVTGIFSTTDTSSIGLLNYTNQPLISGNYREVNKVEFKGAPTVITQDNRTFRFPVSVNCNGTYEFTITAIVHFEDCSVCYITDAFDYNASWRFIIPNWSNYTPNLLGTRQ